MKMLITIVTKRLECASEFRAEQARKELPKLTKNQKAAGITPITACPDPKCGLEAIYAARYGVAWFPCTHTVGNGKQGAFKQPLPIISLPDREPKVLWDVLPDNMHRSVPEDPVVPQRVHFQQLAYNDDPHITFIAEVCQETLALMRTPPSYPRMFRDLLITDQMAKLNDEPIETREWRARF
jgi:hypothetical protein